MKKRLFALVLALSLCLSLALPVSAAFEELRPDPGFSDTEGHWGRDYINTCYRLGLMSGKSESSFDPGGNLSLAEAITVAVRVADIYKGGDGVLDQSGEHWYDGAVARGLEMGLITEGQYSDYGQAALRCELAGLLAHALPNSQYRAINNITELPDVSGMTAYSEEIFRLYNAGILTGSDSYGSFHPNDSITRAELAAILCRLVQPDTRKQFTPEEMPPDLTIYSTDSFLYVDGMAFPGVVTIAGEPYIIAEVFEDNYSGGNYNCYFSSDVGYKDSRGWVDLDLNTPSGDIIVPQYSSRPVGGVNMGTADAARLTLNYSVGREYGSAEEAVCTLDGLMPMLSLKALGAKVEGKDYYIYTGAVLGEDYTLSYEEDLVGQLSAGLRRESQRDTILALHDALVNDINYDPITAYNLYEGAEYDRVHALFEAAWEKYSLGSNVVLDSGYGICQNYMEIFLNLCLRNGIPCVKETGAAGGGSHAWNRVYAEGKWSFVDCTWDDPVGGWPVLRHNYFMVDAETLVKSHLWYGFDYPMPAEYDPAWEQLDPNNITSADMFRKCMVAQFMMGKTSFSLRVTAYGAYGGVACAFYYPIPVWGFQCYYNSTTGTYDFTVTW